MPILDQQPDIFPDRLLSDDYLAEAEDRDWSWWVLVTKSRAEKKLMTWLTRFETAFYCPLLEKRYRSPAGRVRTSFLPAFTGYVFMLGDEEARYRALTTNYVVRDSLVKDTPRFVKDLKQIYDALNAGVRLTPEAQLEKGQRVFVRNGPFKGYEGTVLRREGQTRLLLSIEFLEQGVSMEVDECQLTAI